MFYLFKEAIVLTDRELNDPVPSEYLSHAEKYALDLKNACLLTKKLAEIAALRNNKKG